MAELARPGWFPHLWNEVLQSRGIDQNRTPPPGSFLHGLFIRHGMIRTKRLAK